jgi:glutamate 5-kinase
MGGVIVIKLGSSVVADAGGSLRRSVLDSVCDEVAALRHGGYQPVIVSSGAIALGLSALGVDRPHDIDGLQAASAVGQTQLLHAYAEPLAARGLRAAQVLLTSYDVSVRAHYLNARRTLERLLQWEIVPIINENDTTTTDEISFGDNDFLAAQVAILLGAERLLLLTSVDGLYSSDPRLDPDAQLVRRVTDFAQLAALQVESTTSPLGTGGMRSKVLAAEMGTAAGIAVSIVNGRRAGTIVAAAHGEPVGTEFVAQAERDSSFKLWLRYAKVARGQIRVDAGAAQALRDAGTSLLPVGVVAVEGEFDAGDAVEIVAADGIVGKGISNYSAQDLSQVRGLRSAEIQRLLPGLSEEAVHRDYFVLA